MLSLPIGSDLIRESCVAWLRLRQDARASRRILAIALGLPPRGDPVRMLVDCWL